MKLIIKDGKGAIVAQSDKELKMKAGERLTANIATAEIANPTLWSVDLPTLYTAECQIVDNDKVIDSQSSVFGFRWLDWTADHGFFLNGKHLYLRGANVHQDHAGWCDAITEEALPVDEYWLEYFADVTDIINEQGTDWPTYPRMTEIYKRLSDADKATPAGKQITKNLFDGGKDAE